MWLFNGLLRVTENRDAHGKLGFKTSTEKKDTYLYHDLKHSLVI